MTSETEQQTEIVSGEASPGLPSVPFQKTLYAARARQVASELQTLDETLNELKEITTEARDDMRAHLTSFAMSLALNKRTKFKKEELEAFFDKPYIIEEHRKIPNTWLLKIPKFIDAAFGWLEGGDASYNFFAVNRYMDWLGDLPGEVKKAIGMKDAPDLKVHGEYLTGSKGALKDAWEKYRPLGFVKSMDENGLLINPKRTFDLLANLVHDGIMPFTAKPVDKADLVNPPLVKGDFELKDFQKDAWQKFLEYSNIGVFFPPNIGKTFQAMWAMASLKGPHLVVVPSRILQDQWRDRLGIYTTLKDGIDFRVETYQTAIKRFGDGMPIDGKVVPWSLVSVDEAHHLPANEFAKLALIKRKYTMALSATPYREDGREEFIFAFSGFPVGMGWEFFRKLGLIRKTLCRVWLVKTEAGKYNRLAQLLKDERKTLIFCDSLEIGKHIASRYNIPHVSGETKENRMTLIAEGFAKPPYAVVISRVGDEGISLPGIERIIEISWLGRSRRQELQRHTRLLHGRTEGVESENHILMTLDEYNRDHSRLFSLMDKNFAVTINSDELNEKDVAKLNESGHQAPKAPRVIATRPERPAQDSTPATAQLPATTPTPGLANAVGVQKLMSSMSKSQKKLYSLLIENDGSWFKASKLPFLIGFPPVPASMSRLHDTVRIGDLVKKGLVERKVIEGESCYRTNVRARMS